MNKTNSTKSIQSHNLVLNKATREITSLEDAQVIDEKKKRVDHTVSIESKCYQYYNLRAWKGLRLFSGLMSCFW